MMKKKFKLNTRIGQRVTKVEINITSGERQDSLCLYKDGIHVKELKIVHQTANKIALNDSYITCLDRLKEGDRKDNSMYTYLEEPCISIKTRETYWPNGVFATMYILGDVDKAVKRMTKLMQIKVDKEYGFLYNINISDKVDEYLIKQ